MKKIKRKTRAARIEFEERVERKVREAREIENRAELEQVFLQSFCRLGSDPNLPADLLLSGAYRSNLGMVNVVVSIGELRKVAEIIRRRCLVAP